MQPNLQYVSLVTLTLLSLLGFGMVWRKSSSFTTSSSLINYWGLEAKKSQCTPILRRFCLKNRFGVGWVEERRPKGASRRVTQHFLSLCWVSRPSTQQSKFS